MRAMCSCGREEVELGVDLCQHCHYEYEMRQWGREQESQYYAEQAAEYAEWERQQEGNG